MAVQKFIASLVKVSDVLAAYQALELLARKYSDDERLAKEVEKEVFSN